MENLAALFRTAIRVRIVRNDLQGLSCGLYLSRQNFGGCLGRNHRKKMHRMRWTVAAESAVCSLLESQDMQMFTCLQASDPQCFLSLFPVLLFISEIF